MADATDITYLFDPLCGWCYGAAPALEKLAGQGFTVRLAPTGLFAGDGARPMDEAFAAYAWTNDQRIARLTGQPFSEEYRYKVLADRARLFDSGPASLALTAVVACAPEQEFEALKAVQRARYVDGRDTTDFSVLSDVLSSLRLGDAARRIAEPDGDLLTAYRRRVDAARGEMLRFGVNGVPALIVGAGDDRRLIKASALFGSDDGLLADLKAA